MVRSVATGEANTCSEAQTCYYSFTKSIFIFIVSVDCPLSSMHEISLLQWSKSTTSNQTMWIVLSLCSIYSPQSSPCPRLHIWTVETKGPVSGHSGQTLHAEPRDEVMYGTRIWRETREPGQLWPPWRPLALFQVLNRLYVRGMFTCEQLIPFSLLKMSSELYNSGGEPLLTVPQCTVWWYQFCYIFDYVACGMLICKL